VVLRRAIPSVYNVCIEAEGDFRAGFGDRNVNPLFFGGLRGNDCDSLYATHPVSALPVPVVDEGECLIVSGVNKWAGATEPDKPTDHGVVLATDSIDREFQIGVLVYELPDIFELVVSDAGSLCRPFLASFSLRRRLLHQAI
jgi:hypothetical protein